jgi:hypothetical protein
LRPPRISSSERSIEPILFMFLVVAGALLGVATAVVVAI